MKTEYITVCARSKNGIAVNSILLGLNYKEYKANVKNINQMCITCHLCYIFVSLDLAESLMLNCYIQNSFITMSSTNKENVFNFAKTSI